jgi:class 3 adenylate cyclase/ribosomal protein L40E
MNCQQCGKKNEPAAVFCVQCSQPLRRICPSCSTQNPGDALFCMKCRTDLSQASETTQASKLQEMRDSAPKALQEKLRLAQTEIEGQRKPVTILFTDIVGSTAIAEKLDPEVWREIVAGVHRRVGEAVYRYEGTIAQLLGDGVLAFFGAPITHEDDPIRAVRAAKDIQDSIKDYARELAGTLDEFQMRVGIDTGAVVVGEIGTDMHTEYLAIGDTVNVAARLQSAASRDVGILQLTSINRLANIGMINLVE